MATEPIALHPRNVLLAGATGLVGRELLTLLLDSPHYVQVHLLLRRPVTGLPQHPRLSAHVVDFQALQPLPAVDDVFIALGTTIKDAGSQEAFRRVDFDAVVHTARAARVAGATRLGVVSALGASPRSPVFYSRVKGEMQDAVSGLGYESVVFAQPSLLVGDRASLGQPVRPGEGRFERLMRPVKFLMPRNWWPIHAGDVARALVRAVAEPAPGVRQLPSGQMQPR